MTFWELNLEALGLLQLKASATWCGLVEDLRDEGRRAVPVVTYTLAFALQLRKIMKVNKETAR
jgi:hypothetical protein